MLKRFCQVFKTLPEDFKSGKMDSFQRSTPPNFISFRLENILEEDEQTPDPTNVETSHSSASQPHTVAEDGPQASPLSSVDSETDVNAFAEAMVQIMEKIQSPIREESNPADLNSGKNPEGQEQGGDLSLPEPCNRTSTPVPVAQVGRGDVSSSFLEASLQIAPASRTQLTELLPVQTNDEDVRGEKELSGEETSSSLYDAPPLPDGVSVVRYLTDASEGEFPEQNEDPEVPLLYTGIPQGFESGTEGGDESSSLQIDQPGPSSSTGQTHFKLHELSGRSRALLKEFFETTEAFQLPLGHPTVAFSETQLYHLLKILTNETMSLTYTTMEKMILDALKGEPTTSQPRNDHFRLRTRAQTPARRDSSDSSFGSESGSEEPEHSASGGILDNVTSCEESDGTTKMALISASFAKTGLGGLSTSANVTQPNVVSSDEIGSSGYTS